MTRFFVSRLAACSGEEVPPVKEAYFWSRKNAEMWTAWWKTQVGEGCEYDVVERQGEAVPENCTFFDDKIERILQDLFSQKMGTWSSSQT